MRNSEPGEGHSESAPAGVKSVVNRRSLAVMLGGLSLLGRLSIDAYLPAFADIQRDVQASTADLQLTLTGYLLAFACMSLLHGPLSDVFGRRRVILSALLAFTLAALGCALSPSVGWLTAFRVVQGMSAGVGTVVGRAIIRDCFDGAAAARLLALVSMIFSLSPALAPVFGGWVVTLFTWRAIFLALFAYAVAMLALCVRRLPETLPRHGRRPFGIGILKNDYVAVFGNRRFRLVALALALSFAGLFLYVASVPAFLGHELGLPPTEYAAMFVPIVAGIVLGSLAAERLAGRAASTRLILAGFSIQLVTGIVNVTFLATHGASVPGSVLPLGFYAFGMSLATPGLILVGLDQFPQMRGLAASCQAFAMVLLAGLVTQLAPTFGGRARVLGLVQGVLCIAAFASWLVTIRPYERNG
ncbi:MAG: transporter, family, multidrug resistance protein [Bradyrhizobium sp.]|nr:transporter, family, multidrug resistance protein [Bradyrhizobium sp.]